jgi:hypothetical protein
MYGPTARRHRAVDRELSAQWRFLGSTRLRVLAEIHRSHRGCGLELRVLKPSVRALRVIQIRGLDRVLSVSSARTWLDEQHAQQAR